MSHVLCKTVEQLIPTMNFSLNLRKQFKAAESTHGHTLQYIIEDSIGYVSAAQPGLQHRICFKYLEDLRNEYKQNPTSTKGLKSFMEKKMYYYSYDPSADQLRNLQTEVNVVKEIMHDNIDKALQRGERLEIIEDRTSELMERSAVWQKASRSLRYEMLRKNYFCYALLGVGLVIVIAVVAGVLATFV